MMDADSNPTGRIVTFYSYKGGAGRTMALANAAWIMACNGLRVLTVDWDLESPGLHRYFHPFLRDKHLRSASGVIELIRGYADATMRPGQVDTQGKVAALARILNHAVSLDWDFLDSGGGIDFVPAGQQEPAYSKAVSTFDWQNFFERQRGGVFLDALAADMRKHYDYVLIDSRTGLSDTAGICTVRLPDIVVNCFTLSTQSIEGAAAIARSIRGQRGDRPLTLLPVPMRVENGEKARLEIARDASREAFDSFVDDFAGSSADRYWGDVEIPYIPYYAYEEILATFGDRAHQEGSLLAAYERLTAAITGRPEIAMPAIDEDERRGWLQAFERRPVTVVAGVVLTYASIDRTWAEWVAAELTDAGMRVRLQVLDYGPATSGADLEGLLATGRTVVALLSRNYTSLIPAAHLWKNAAGHDVAGGRVQLVPLRIDLASLPAPFNERMPTDIAGLSEERAREQLRVAFALSRPSTGSGAAGTQAPPSNPDRVRLRYPGTSPPVWNVPSRNHNFTGRDSTLDLLRDRLSASATVVMPQTLFGLGGIGKTQIAIEYAYRFAADYDVVWWLPAEHPSAVRNGLVKLAAALGLPTEDPTANRINAVLDALRLGRPYRRWLLVFDNASDPSKLVDLLPQGPGHVLLTSRDRHWAEHATTIELGVFTRAESISLLRARCPGLPEDDAATTAADLGDLPLAIEQAGAWLATTGMSAGEYRALLRDQTVRILAENRPHGYPETAAATWLISLERLRRETPAGALVLELCAFLAPEPIPLSLLATGRFVELLTEHDPTLHDPILHAKITAEIDRYALAKLDTCQGTIQLHRLVQAVIREQLSAERTAQYREYATEIIISADPKDPDLVRNWQLYGQLLPHMSHAGILNSISDTARQLVTNLVRYLWQLGDRQGSEHLANEALARWKVISPLPGVPELLLRFHRANAIRSQARYEEALTEDRDVHIRLVGWVGADHRYALMAARSLAADLRMLGRYGEAHRMDLATLRGFMEVLGPNHPQTLMARNNLAVSMRMVGDFQGAAEQDREILEDRRHELGEQDPYTLSSASNYGRDLREIGKMAGSRSLLENTLESFRRVVGEDHPCSLRTAKNLAITLRKASENQLAHSLTTETLARYRMVYGPLHPEALACEMTLATTTAALGEDVAGAELAQTVLDNLQRVLAESHLYLLSCRNNLAVLLNRCGDYPRSAPVAHDTYKRLLFVLGEQHIYTAIGAMNLANSLYHLGETQQVTKLDEYAHRCLLRTLGEDHPDSLAATNNLAMSRIRSGDRASGQRMYEAALARALATMGQTHHRVVLAAAGKRVNCYVEPAKP